jgi:hypothetical protein
MAKTRFGQYGAFTTPSGGLRFQLITVVDGKEKTSLIKESSVPAEIVTQLERQLQAGEDQVVQPDPVVEEPKAFTPQPAPLAPTDFDDTPDVAPEQFPPEVNAPLNTEPERNEWGNRLDGVQDPALPPLDTVTTPSAPLEGTSIFDAPIEDMARALFERFGVYTVFLGRHPEADEISPLTAERMSNYDRGVAYQAATKALSQGKLGQSFETLRANQIRNKAGAQSAQLQPPAPVTPRRAGDGSSFAERTAVNFNGGENPNGVVAVADEEGELIATPSINELNRNPLIRPRW